MPNILIMGCLTQEEIERARQLRHRIHALFRDKDYRGEVVVTIVPSSTEDYRHRPMPYLLLANSCQEHTEEIKELIKTMGMDIERIKLEEFIPAPAAKEEAAAPAATEPGGS